MSSVQPMESSQLHGKVGIGVGGAVVGLGVGGAVMRTHLKVFGGARSTQYSVALLQLFDPSAHSLRGTQIVP